MTFVQPEFVLFLAIVLVVYWNLGTVRRQNVFLLVASAVFYGWVHPWFLVLLYASALTDWAAGLAMALRPEHRRTALVAAIGLNLTFLFTFKYFDFFLDNVESALHLVGLHVSLPALGLLLPVGISFYTFQSMSYSISVYRGEIQPRRDPVDFLVFVSFFPQLVAGPIERAGNLLTQVERPRRWDGSRAQGAVTLALWGAFKKLCIADSVAPYVDKVFASAHPPLLLSLAGALGFAVQILADFSGYTDIARGTARLLGFELTLNFRHPYLATSPSDFWRRWHISLSSWIQDYLYVPLGGGRGGFFRSALAASAALLLSGLWHGAAWHYVLWGAWHAALLIGYRAVGPRVPAAVRGLPGARLAAIGLMFGFTCIGWLIFRQADVSALAGLVTHPTLGDPASRLLAGVVAGVACVMALPMVAAMAVEEWLVPRLGRAPWAQTTAWALLVASMFVFAADGSRAFIYFRF